MLPGGQAMLRNGAGGGAPRAAHVTQAGGADGLASTDLSGAATAYGGGSNPGGGPVYAASERRAEPAEPELDEAGYVAGGGADADPADYLEPSAAQMIKSVGIPLASNEETRCAVWGLVFSRHA